MNPALPLLSCLILASCAPALLPRVDGRIVNVSTGQEGTIIFLGGFRDRAALSTDPDNVTVTFGDTVYRGRYTVLGRSTPRLGIGLGLGFGNSFTNGYEDRIFGPSASSGTGYGSGYGYGGGIYGSYRPFADDQASSRPGNLIVRSATGNTLSCTFQTDPALHGIGNCQDSVGAAYTLQF